MYSAKEDSKPFAGKGAWTGFVLKTAAMSKQRGGYYRFSADYNGYKKLFYFWEDGFWIVSNSLHRISAHLRQHGFRVVANEAQLAAMATEGTFYPTGRGSFFSQPTSFDTIIRGVRLVPADRVLWIGPSGVRLEKAISHRPDDAYEHQLGRFISVWSGRLSTLVNDYSIGVSCDLTGGLDSRTVLALLLTADGWGSSDQPQIRSGPGLAAWKDRLVAATISKQLGLSLNGRLGKKPVVLGAQASYALWKDLCLGVYHPIYFQRLSARGEFVHFGGGGGENQRPFYGQFRGAKSADEFVARRTRNIVRPSARPDFAAALQQAVDTITEGSPEHQDALICHYRHFRNRFHFGREPQYAVTFLPLGSKLLDNVTAVAGKTRFLNARMHYDILHNLWPELLDIPFDKRRKRPGSIVRENLPSVTVSPAPSGACFIDDSQASSSGTSIHKESTSAIDLLREEFCRAKSGFAGRFLGNAYIRRAERALGAAPRKGGFSGPIRSKRVAVVMACGMFDPE